MLAIFADIIASFSPLAIDYYWYYFRHFAIADFAISPLPLRWSDTIDIAPDFNITYAIAMILPWHIDASCHWYYCFQLMTLLAITPLIYFH
jgi:hypothetical protein